ncbi:MAG: YbjN protein [Sphingomonas bacterium]|uniref:YbjN domain-containing protein n=1 Tax=Sphingomonas bacterium TaxID=1895847 RepID=UPI002634BEB5|nr:YbjN domain-containing protein [Sphingomonas bacterium]MDB5703739.1 YbjN protein [Sphingomonas bacterium]
MRRLIAILAPLLGMTIAGQAAAQDKLLDLRQPTIVVGALHDAGYKAELKQNSKGEPYVLSSANGSDFTIEFYGCTGQNDCGSYQFSSWYKAEPLFTIALANEWNVGKRFLKIAVDKDGNLNEYMDFTAIGKTTQANFADIVDWYQVMDADLAKFVAAKKTPAAK